MTEATEAKVVLVIDDDPDERELARLAFRRNRDAFRRRAIECRLVMVDGPDEAWNYLVTAADSQDQQTRMPQLMITNLMMGVQGNGLSFLEQLRSERRFPWIPVIVLSSSLQPQDVQRAYELGANSYLKKPVDFSQFVKQIRLLVDYWLRLNVAPPTE